MFSRTRCGSFRRRRLELAASPPDIAVSEPVFDTDHWVYTVSSVAGGTVFDGETELGAAPQAVPLAYDAAYSFTVVNDNGTSDQVAGSAPADPHPAAPTMANVTYHWEEDGGYPGWYYLIIDSVDLAGCIWLHVVCGDGVLDQTFDGSESFPVQSTGTADGPRDATLTLHNAGGHEAGFYGSAVSLEGFSSPV